MSSIKNKRKYQFSQKNIYVFQSVFEGGSSKVMTIPPVLSNAERFFLIHNKLYFSKQNYFFSSHEREIR